MEPGEREQDSVPDGWTVITYKTRPSEYGYSNSVTGKDVRVRERPTEPPPMGLDLLRKPDNASGWFGVSIVGRKKDTYQAKWWCHELKRDAACAARPA